MTVLFSIGITMAQTKKDSDNTKMGMQNIKTPAWRQNQNEASIALSINGKKQMQLKLEERSLKAFQQAFEEKRYTIILKNTESTGMIQGAYPFLLRTKIHVNGNQIEAIEEEQEVDMFPGDIFIPIEQFALLDALVAVMEQIGPKDQIKIELSVQSLQDKTQVDALVFFL